MIGISKVKNENWTLLLKYKNHSVKIEMKDVKSYKSYFETYEIFVYYSQTHISPIAQGNCFRAMLFNWTHQN